MLSIKRTIKDGLMFEFKIIRDANGAISHIETGLHGQNLLNMSKLNKGCAFTTEERELFNLSALTNASMKSS